MPNVTVTGPGVITGHFVSQGITFYGWTFPVVVDGQAGVYTVWIDTNDPADAAGVEADAVEDLEDGAGELGGIAENDPGSDQGGLGDSGDFGDFGDDEGGDAVATNGGGEFGESV